MTTMLTVLALCSALTALGFSLFALAVVRRSSTERLLRQLSALSEAQESLNLQIRSVKVRLSALSRPRKGGRFAESDNDDGETSLPDPQKAALAWKRDMNLKLALGKVKP